MIALILLAASHTPTKSQIIRDARADLAAYAKYLGDYSANPPVFTTDEADSMYVLRGEADIQIVETTLKQFRHNQVGVDAIARAMQQLERDLEDIPPAQTKSATKHHHRI